MGSWWTKIAARWASVQGPGKDTAQFPVQQVTYQGKVADCVMLFPYGMHANVDGASLGVFYAMGGDPGDRAGMFTSMTRRSQLAGGDVEVYSPVSRSRVTFRANGDVEVDAKANLVVSVAGGLTATVTGAADVTAASASVTAATIAITGAVTINGTLAVTGNASFAGTMTNAGKDVGATHGHVQANDGGGDSEAPISGVT